MSSDTESLQGPPEAIPPPWLLDRQGWSTLLAGALLPLISFITNFGDDHLLQFGRLQASHQIGMGLHLAALAALAGDTQLATRLRHRDANEAAEDRIARKREAAAREREALEAAVDEVGRRPKKENERLAALESRMDALLRNADSSSQTPPSTGSS